MLNVLTPLMWGGVAYLLGSVLWGQIIAARAGVDILAVGTRNPGAGNVLREIGAREAVLVYAGDALCAAAAVAPAALLPNAHASQGVAVLAVVMGAFYPVFWGFRGGGGLAKATGVMLGLDPMAFLVGGPIGLAVALVAKNSGVGGAVAIGATGLISGLLYRDAFVLGLMLLASLLVLARARHWAF